MREDLTSMAVNHIRWTRRGIAGFVVTVLVVGVLLAVFWARLLTANQQVQALPSSPLVGHTAPDFTLTIYNGTPGQKIHLADLKGHPVVINFWASWCQPCQEEMPIIEAAYQKYRGDGVIFVGVDFEDKADAAMAFVRQYGVTYPVGPDTTNGDIAIAYGVTGTPETAFVGRSGVVTQKVGGALDDRTLEQAIQHLLKT